MEHVTVELIGFRRRFNKSINDSVVCSSVSTSCTAATTCRTGPAHGF